MSFEGKKKKKKKGDYAHAIIDRRDREVGIGGASEIIKRAQSVTHRLLSANTEEDQTSARSETRTLSHSPAHIHTRYRNGE